MLERSGAKPGMSVDQFGDTVRSGFERIRAERERDAENGDDRRGERGRPSGNINQVNSAFRAKDKERVTVDLPPKYKEFDTDSDEQLGLYEWIIAKRESLKQFDQIDADADGMLTPLELKFYEEIEKAGEPRVVSYKTDRLLIVGPSGRKSGNSGDSQKKSSKDGKKLSKEEREKQSEISKKYFAGMDKNKDGKLDPDEFDKRRLVPWFEKAGIEVKTMSEKEFGKAFVTAVERTKT